MKIVVDSQVRLTSFPNKLTTEAFIKKMPKGSEYTEVNDTLIFVWNYPGRLDNEKIFNSYIIMNNIIILMDSETQDYISFRDGDPYDHAIFKDISRWVKIKYDRDKKRLLRTVSRFRKNFLAKKLKSEYYRGIYSDRFSINFEGTEYLSIVWSDDGDVNLLGLEENFSFFIRVCKLIL